MADSIYFQDKDDLKKIDVQDAINPDDAITYASDYIDLANKINTGFDLIDVDVVHKQDDIELPMRSSIGSPSDILFDDNPNIRSAKSYKQYVDGMVHGEEQFFDTLDKTRKESDSPAKYLYNQIVVESTTAESSTNTIKSNVAVCKGKVDSIRGMEDQVISRISYASTIFNNMTPSAYANSMASQCKPF